MALYVSDGNTLHKISNLVVGGATSGSDEGDGKYEVIVYDYDGTILKKQKLNTGDVFELPALPTNHERLVATGYCATTDIVDNKIVVKDSDVSVGVLYDTKSGFTEFDIVLTKASGLTFKLSGIAKTNGIDWGDGVTDTATSHTYAEYGKYTIMCDTTYLNTSSSSGIFGQTSSSPNLTVTEMRMSSKVTGRILCNYCYALESVVVSPNTTNWVGNCFEYCVSLKHVTFVRNGSADLGSFCRNCYSLKSFVLGKGVTAGTGSDFLTYTPIRSFVFPDGFTTTNNGERYFNNCYLLERISMPDTVTVIGASMSYYSYNVRFIRVSKNITAIQNGFLANAVQYTGTIDFSHFEKVPTLSTVYAFQYLNPQAKMVVPDALYDAWIAATNWSNFVGHIYKASEV